PEDGFTPQRFSQSDLNDLVRDLNLPKECMPGTKNVLHEPLVDPQKVLLPPQHIKLGLMKQFVRALPKHGSCF
ncbi:hypothetical protein L9F63_016761, partial [Diploptera punctata]